MLNICAKFHKKNQNGMFQEVTTSLTNKETNQPTDQQTHVITTSPNKLSDRKFDKDESNMSHL